MRDFLNTIEQALHEMGLHLSSDAATDAVQAASDVASRGIAHLDMTSLIALAGVLGWASGVRLYAVVFLLGAAGASGFLQLPSALEVLASNPVLMVSGALMLIEFFADKVPLIDSAWDFLHGFLKVPAGALLAAGVFGADGAAATLIAGLLGGSLAATSFATKATLRAAANTSPEPFSNWGLSLFEDGALIFLMGLAVLCPWLALTILIIVIIISFIILKLLWRFTKILINKIKVLTTPRQ